MATFRLAETYDPRVLSRWSPFGISGDRRRAREVHTKAFDVGCEGAREHRAHIERFRVVFRVQSFQTAGEDDSSGPWERSHRTLSSIWQDSPSAPAVLVTVARQSAVRSGA